MPTFNYSSGNINNLVNSGPNANMADIQGPLVDVRDFINGQIGDSNLSGSAAIAETKLANGSAGLAKGSFSAYRNAALSLATGAAVVFDTEEFDTSGWFDTTNGRFTPQVAGFYRLSWSLRAGTALTADVFWGSALRKNSTDLKLGSSAFQRGASLVISQGSHVVQANGSTDFFDVRTDHTVGGATSLQNVAVGTFFGGELVGRS